MSAEMLPQPPSSSVADVEPGRIKVFGIIHIIFGGLGLMNVIGGIGMQILQEPFIRLTNQGESEEMVALQMQMYREMALTTWISTVISVIVAVLVLRAGIALVKRRQSAVKASNVYVVASLVAKAAGVLLFCMVVMPVASGAMDSMLDESIPDVKTILAVIKVTMAVAGVLAPLLGAVYPLCALVMLNKPQVKEFLAKNGT